MEVNHALASVVRKKKKKKEVVRRKKMFLYWLSVEIKHAPTSGGIINASGQNGAPESVVRMVLLCTVSGRNRAPVLVVIGRNDAAM